MPSTKRPLLLHLRPRLARSSTEPPMRHRAHRDGAIAGLAALVALSGCAAASPQPSGDRMGTAPGSSSSGAEPIVASAGSRNGAPVASAPAPSSADAAPGSPSTPAGALLALGPSFQPDPVVRRGQAGGPVRADTRDPSCRGYITAEPSYTLKLDAPIADLRVLVAMSGDATLVVQLENGQMLCNDDSEGLNPAISGTSFPAGQHRVWVGTYSEDAVGSQFTIAFTRQLGLSTHAHDGMPVTP